MKNEIEVLRENGDSEVLIFESSKNNITISNGDSSNSIIISFDEKSNHEHRSKKDSFISAIKKKYHSY